MSDHSVALTQEQSQRLDALVDSGMFANQQDVLNEALALVEVKQARHAAKVKALLDAAQVGIDDIEAGRCHRFETPEELEHFIKKTFEEGLQEARTNHSNRSATAKAA